MKTTRSSIYDAWDQIQNEVMCPVDLILANQAVTLWPCTHKIQENIAIKLFGPLKEDWKVSIENHCPVCRNVVIGYKEDKTIKNIVEILNSTFQNISEKKEEEEDLQYLPTKCLSVKSDPSYYPGKPAKFVLTGGNWSPSTRSHPILYVEFTSLIKDSLIKNFSFSESNSLGYSLRIKIEFSPKDQQFADYLKRFKINLESYHFNRGCYESKAMDEKEVMALYQILALNNEIPQNDLENILSVIKNKGVRSNKVYLWT